MRSNSARLKPTPGRPLAGEDDAAVRVVPGVPLVLAEDRELDAVDGAELVEREAERHRDEDIDFDERLAAFVVGAQRQSAGAIRR